MVQEHVERETASTQQRTARPPRAASVARQLEATATCCSIALYRWYGAFVGALCLGSHPHFVAAYPPCISLKKWSRESFQLKCVALYTSFAYRRRFGMPLSQTLANEKTAAPARAVRVRFTYLVKHCATIKHSKRGVSVAPETRIL